MNSKQIKWKKPCLEITITLISLIFANVVILPIFSPDFQRKSVCLQRTPVVGHPRPLGQLVASRPQRVALTTATTSPALHVRKPDRRDPEAVLPVPLYLGGVESQPDAEVGGRRRSLPHGQHQLKEADPRKQPRTVSPALGPLRHQWTPARCFVQEQLMVSSKMCKPFNVITSGTLVFDHINKSQ